MEVENLGEFFSECKMQMKEGNVYGALEKVLEKARNTTFCSSNMQFFDDFLIEFNDHCSGSLLNSRQNLEAEPDNDDYMDQHSAMQAQFSRGLSALASIELLYNPECERSIRGHKMLINVLIKLYEFENSTRDKALLRQEVVQAFGEIFLAMPEMNLCSVLYAMHAYIMFCENQNMNDGVQQVINARINGYRHLRGDGSLLYRTYVRTLYHSCEGHQDGIWKRDSLREARIAMQRGDMEGSIVPLLAFIDFSYEPVEMHFYSALRAALLEVVGEKVKTLYTSDVASNLGRLFCEEISDICKDVEFTLSQKLTTLSFDVPVYFGDKMYVYLLTADNSYLTKEFIGDEQAFNVIEMNLVGALDYAILGGTRPEFMLDLVNALNSYIPHLPKPEEPMFRPIHELLGQFLTDIDNKPQPDDLREAVEQLKKVFNEVMNITEDDEEQNGEGEEQEDEDGENDEEEEKEKKEDGGEDGEESDSSPPPLI